MMEFKTKLFYIKHPEDVPNIDAWLTSMASNGYSVAISGYTAVPIIGPAGYSTVCITIKRWRRESQLPATMISQEGNHEEPTIE